MLKFGDTFRMEEDEYVFFLRTEKYCFLANIFNKEQSEVLIQGRERAERRSVGTTNTGVRNEVNNNMYCFTQLTTESFERQIALLVNTERDTDALDGSEDYIKPLNSTDLDNIKREIKDGEFLPKPLRDYVDSL